MHKKLAALAATAALGAAVVSPAAGQDDPCPGPNTEPVSASGTGPGAVAADRNGDDQVCFNSKNGNFRDNHVHSH